MSLWEYLWAGSWTTKALYHLNGDTNDSSGNWLNWTWIGTWAYTAGKFWQCANFSGTNMIYTSDDTAISWTSVTHFVWVKSTWDNQYITSRDWYAGWAAFYMAIWEGTANKLNILLTGTTNTWRQVSTSSINDWNRHLVWFTYDGANLKIYIDTKLEATNAQTWWITATSRPILIWWRRNSAWLPYNIYRWLVWQIDEIIMEHSVWTQSKINKYRTYTKGRFGIL